jgi:hypothetical protein
VHQVGVRRRAGHEQPGEVRQSSALPLGGLVGCRDGDRQDAGADRLLAHRHPDPHAVATLGGDRRTAGESASGQAGGDVLLRHDLRVGEAGNRLQHDLAEVDEVEDHAGADPLAGPGEQVAHVVGVRLALVGDGGLQVEHPPTSSGSGRSTANRMRRADPRDDEPRIREARKVLAVRSGGR